MKWIFAIAAGLVIAVVGLVVTTPEPPAPVPQSEEEPVVDLAVRAAELRAEPLPPPFDALVPHAAPKTPPRPFEWLSEHPEEGQSLAEFSRDAASASGRVVYLVPVGTLSELHAEVFTALEPLVRAWLQLEVRRLPAVGAREAAVGQRKGVTGSEQWYTETILALLRTHRPADAVAVMGVTGVDLYPDPDWNFVYGQADWEAGVGISSMARDGEGGADLTLFRRRAFTTTVHEVGHMLGLAHCVAWECAMNGSNHRAEADSRPLEPCPACLAKLQRVVGFDPRVRWSELEVAYAAAGLHDGAAAARESLRRTPPDAGR